MLVISEPGEAAGTIAAATIHVVRGCDSILRLQRVLADLSVKCGQPGVMDDVGYFLSKPGTLTRVPHLMLFSKTPGMDPVLDVERLTANDLLGAVLLYRYVVLGCGIGIFSTNDRSGRGTLVAPPALRSSLAEMAIRSLMHQGVHAVLISFRDGDSGKPQQRLENTQPIAASTVDEGSTRWVWRQREVADYLPLEPTFDRTLAKIGTRTRRNMRYYRKRAEAELGCVFLPHVEIDEREFLNFNCECMYAVPAKVASWRYRSLKHIAAPLFMGIKDRDGRWLSMLGGRRHHGGAEILWQMNRSGLSACSLSLVMRSYFIEHEIAHGMTKLYMEGGTAHPMRFSFLNDKVTDLVVLRRSRLALVVPALARLLIKPDNDLALMLLDKSLYGGKAPNGSRHLASLEEEGS